MVKIILVTHKKSDYVCLKNLGIKHILWFKSLEKAAIYFEENPEDLKNYDIFFERYIRGTSNSKLQLLLWENKENILRVEFYSYRFNKSKETLKLTKQKKYGVDIYLDENYFWLPYDCIIGGEKYKNVTISFVLTRMMEYLVEQRLNKKNNSEESSLKRIKEFKK